MIFSIRDIYVNPETDNGMNFAGKLAELVEQGLLIEITNVHYVKYKGLQFGSGHQEEGANVKIYQKPQAPATEPPVEEVKEEAASTENQPAAAQQE